MKKLRNFIAWCKGKYALLAEKKYTTIAGTLVYFLIMSVTPLAFWLTLLFGRLSIDPEKVLTLPVFDSVENILLFIQKEAANATTGASVFLLATTLYSATNFFYHMRRSGEIIYEYKRKKHGLLVRLGALLLMFAMILLAVVSAGSGGRRVRLFPYLSALARADGRLRPDDRHIFLFGLAAQFLRLSL